MEGAVAFLTSAIIRETINQGVSRVFTKAVEIFQGVDTKRKLLILLTNDTKEDWVEAMVYTEAGTSNGVPPKIIKPGEGGAYILRRSKTPMVFGGGAIKGILTYTINRNGDVLAIYFKIPIDNHVFKSNYWNVKIYTADEFKDISTTSKPLYNLFKEMDSNKAAADDSYNFPECNDELSYKYEVKVIMSTSARCKYRIDVTTDDNLEEENESSSSDEVPLSTTSAND